LDFFKGENKMGRPLKIQKYGPAQGITYPNNTSANVPAAAVPIDQGYPQFSQLTNPVYYSSLTADNFYGVVGGTRSTATTATFPVIKVLVNIALPDGTGQGQNVGYIIRQKGAHKYLVGSLDLVQDEDIVVGAAYRINNLDTTNWQQMGAPAGAIVGTIFTCTALCANPQNGNANLVGQCVLTSDLTLSNPGTMSISYAVGGDSTEVAVSKLTNKFLQGWAGFTNAAGTSLTTYDSGGNNAGEVDYSGETTFLSNFFTDEADAEATKSGADAQTFSNGTGDIELAQVEKWTS
jgi:hypothetical protein